MIRYFKQVGRDVDVVQRWIRFRLRASRFNPWRIPLLSPRMFSQKRVIILGPAATVFDDLSGISVDEFDVVVRLNSGLALKNGNAELGTRTDVLFHNLNEDGPRRAGAIPPQVLVENGVRFCVFPHWGFKGSKTRLYKKQAELLAYPQVSLRVLPRPFCEALRRRLKANQPTVGASAIMFFLCCDLKELQIHGFTFFQTAYAPGYNDAIESGPEAFQWAIASMVHNPDIERSVIRDALADAREQGANIVLGKNVSKCLAEGASGDRIVSVLSGGDQESR